MHKLNSEIDSKTTRGMVSFYVLKRESASINSSCGEMESGPTCEDSGNVETRRVFNAIKCNEPAVDVYGRA